MARVRIKGLKKSFGKTTAVKGIDLAVNDKDLVVLLGPSGCGKTTTLRCVAGLEEPDEGEIFIGNDLVNDLPPKDRDVAMVFQSYALYPHMKVFDNIAFPLKLRKYSKSDTNRMVTKAADLLKIKHLLDRKPKQLSGGEAQRVALGRAIVREPKVFLMDEPLSNLDAKLRLYMRVELKALQKQLGVTTIYVTHDQAEAMTLADEIAIMNKGLLQQKGGPTEIYDKPANMFVAGFIGSPPLNFINCSFVEKGKAGFLDAGLFSVPLSENFVEAIKSKKYCTDVVLGVRPEDVRIAKNRKEALLEAEVFVIEPLGAEVIVDLRVGDDLIKMKASPSTKLSPGDKVELTFDEEKTHVFDKKTEIALV